MGNKTAGNMRAAGRIYGLVSRVVGIAGCVNGTLPFENPRPHPAFTSLAIVSLAIDLFVLVTMVRRGDQFR